MFVCGNINSVMSGSEYIYMYVYIYIHSWIGSLFGDKPLPEPVLTDWLDPGEPNVNTFLLRQCEWKCRLPWCAIFVKSAMYKIINSGMMTPYTVMKMVNIGPGMLGAYSVSSHYLNQLWRVNWTQTNLSIYNNFHLEKKKMCTNISHFDKVSDLFTNI